MSTIIFLVIWLQLTDAADKPVAAAQFVTSYSSMKDCTAVKQHIEASTPEAKGKLSCMQVVAGPLVDAGASF